MTEIKDTSGNCILKVEANNLQGVKLTEADLRKAYLREANLRGSALSWTNLQEADLRGANLKGALLFGANLKFCDLRWADLRGAYLCEANLAYVNLDGARLIGADFSHADLSYSTLVSADLRYANLRMSNLTEANLTWANMHGVDMFGSNCLSAIGDFLRLKGTRDALIAIDSETVLVGCESHSIRWWLANYRAVGEEFDYSQEQIEEYRLHLEHAAHWLECKKDRTR